MGFISKDVNKFLKHSVSFIALALSVSYVLFFLPLDFLLQNPEDNYLVRWHDFYNRKSDADIVVLGSSRAHRHYDPNIMGQILDSKIENISTAGALIDLQSSLFYDYLQNNQNPKLLIINLDLGGLAHLGALSNPEFFVPYISNSSDFLKNFPERPFFKYKVYGYTKFKDKYYDKLIYPDNRRHVNGYLPRDIPWTDDFEEFKTENPNGMEFEINDSAIMGYRKFVKEVLEKNIKVILCYSPEFHKVWEFQKNRDEIKSVYKSISNDLGIVFFDYAVPEVDINYNKKLFYNSQHLNVHGAEEFSKDLAERISKLI